MMMTRFLSSSESERATLAGTCLSVCMSQRREENEVKQLPPYDPTIHAGKKFPLLLHRDESYGEGRKEEEENSSSLK